MQPHRALVGEAATLLQCARALQGIPGDMFQVQVQHNVGDGAPATAPRFCVVGPGPGLAWAVAGVSPGALWAVLESVAAAASLLHVIQRFHEMCNTGTWCAMAESYECMGPFPGRGGGCV
jgi:hypothetical protein